MSIVDVCSVAHKRKTFFNKQKREIANESFFSPCFFFKSHHKIQLPSEALIENNP